MAMKALRSFKKENADVAKEGKSFAENVLKKSKLSCSMYQNLSHIPPTSNRAERFP